MYVIYIALGCHRIDAAEGGVSRTVWMDLDNLNLAKDLWRNGDRVIVSEVQRLIVNANAKLNAGPYSVVYSDVVAPDGNPHTYVSYGAYWWPNPDTPDGLPWISRDGFVNKANNVDGTSLCELRRASENLSLAYFFTEDEKYAARAAELLRVWFLDEDTYMQPSNEYAMIIPERSRSFDVAGFGNCMPAIYDSASILEGSSSWTAQDEAGLKAWTTQFLDWAKTSRRGEIQFKEPSNHGTNYDFLMAMFSLYVGDADGVAESAEHFAYQRMPGQLGLDGSNVLEMKRANNLQYHWYNLGRSFDLAAVARKVDGTVDIFDYKTDDGRGLRDALEFLLPYLTLEKEWDKFPGDPFKVEPLYYFELLRRAADYYQEPLLVDAADSLGYSSSFYYTQYVNLTHPRQAVAEPLLGDFDTDGLLTVKDLDLMTQRMMTSTYFGRYDMNNDLTVDLADRRYIVTALFKTSFGDANLDGVFDSSDLIAVLRTGHFEDRVEGNASWGTGDWNGDGEFDVSDLILAMAEGRYETSIVGTSVPEPIARTIVLSAMLVVATARRCFVRSA